MVQGSHLELVVLLTACKTTRLRLNPLPFVLTCAWQEVRATSCGPMKPSTLRALQNTLHLMEKASGKRVYQSRLTQSQVRQCFAPGMLACLVPETCAWILASHVMHTPSHEGCNSKAQLPLTVYMALACFA